MKIHQLSTQAATHRTDLLALIQFRGERDATFKALDEAADGKLTERLREAKFTGKKNQTVVIDSRDMLGATWLVVYGGGAAKEFRDTDVRDFAAVAAKEARRRRCKKAAFIVPRAPGQELIPAVHFAALGAELGLYRFDKYKKQQDDGKHEVRSFDVVVDAAGKKLGSKDSRAASDAVKSAGVIASAIARARDLVNEPAGFLTPSQMVRVAQSIAKKSPQLSVKVLGRKECEKLGMGMYLAVARGSAQEPKFIHLTYKPKKTSKNTRRIALIGKGVMFDSGGYSIKPQAAMLDMKIDMGGAAAVLSSMEAIAALNVPHEIHAITACCENMVSGDAYKLGDVLRAMDGTTVEINNTDAEGRLTLGDAITYAREKVKPDEIIDFATLTGACMVALGPYTAGVMSKNEGMAERWLSAAERAGESMWRLPLNPKLREQLKSHVADMRNCGERYGGAITAGLFLAHFAKDSAWLHVDVAGPAFLSRDQPSSPRGGSGFAVATIVDYLRS